MKTKIIATTIFAMLIPMLIHAQNEERVNYIRGGFYMIVGPVIPVGNYALGQTVKVTNPKTVGYLDYLPARIGGALDMGFLIYFGPAFANKHLRLGMDATFLSVWFNSTRPVDPYKPYNHYYYYGGQKFGPLLTINPVDRLMLDLSYKINANFAYHLDEWDENSESSFSKYGATLFRNEFSFAIRYRVMMFSAQYSFGNMKYDNFDDRRPTQSVKTDVFKIMFGLKF